jgi:hypothetical protein
MKKLWLFTFIALMPVVLADTLQNVWNSILYDVGGLSFLNLGPDTAVIAFTRILIWIMIFAVFFAVMTGLKSVAPFKYFSRGQAGIIATVMATISAVFLPGNVLAATGVGWATAIALLLIGGPIVGLAFLLWKIPWEGEETKFTVALKLILCFLLLWILAAMKVHVGRLGI